MPWVKLDDGFPFHRKSILAGKDGRALYVTALCWTSGQLTDGFIDAAAIAMLAATSDVANAEANAKQLVNVGLWEVVDGGYQIHDYHDYNPPASKVKAIRRARSEAGRRGGIASGSKRQANAQANASANSKRNPTPSPSPSPTEDTDLGADAPTPTTLPEWQAGYLEAANQAGYIGVMLNTLYPAYYANHKPNYGFIGKLRRKHDPDYMLSLIWQHSARPPSGDPLRFVSGILSKETKAGTTGTDWKLHG